MQSRVALTVEEALAGAQISTSDWREKLLARTHDTVSHLARVGGCVSPAPIGPERERGVMERPARFSDARNFTFDGNSLVETIYRGQRVTIRSSMAAVLVSHPS